ncbi:MAG TPA: ribonuclease HII [Bacillota bacterium]|jgi:ribonuclease HII|nr:ribonuclease HII [Clostridiales bacterium UBA9856]HOA42623.1 ribonuclease HII [Bacillota bacterium]HPZ59639.1 ribonuclease HII [Bacillota bacterium]HQC81831.1 ribonuclease HII [Bacillota bacterium]
MKKEERLQLLQEKLVRMKQHENALYEKGIQYIAGVDEAGRGPLAGPVVAAAVVLPKDFNILGVDDSKKLSPKKREELFVLIKEAAVAYGIGCVDNETIDRINILEATKLAMKDALRQLEASLRSILGEEWKKLTGDENRQKPCCIQHILIDGLALPDVPIPQTAIVHGDAISVSIAAASILAKVTRDQIMMDNHRIYPGYAFDCNKGYGTKAHYEGIKLYGLCPIHRRTFLHK